MAKQDKAAGGGGNGKGGGDAPAAEEEVVIGVPVHCDGCARKLRRSLQQRLDGVGDVTVDSRTNRVVLRGRRAAENAPDAVKIVQRKTGEKAVLLSPSPAPEKKGQKAGAKKLDAAGGGANKGDVDDDELPGMDMKMATVLRINLHCDACCEEIKRRILKITGVEEAVPHLKSSQMLVKGMVEPATLVGFIHKCTGRKSGILRAEPLPDDLPQPKTPTPPAGEAETNKKDEAPAAENSSSEEKKNGGGEVEEKGGAEEEDDDNTAGDKNPKAAEEKETTHSTGEEEAPDDNAAGAGDGGGHVVENRTKDDRLFTVPMPAGVVTVAPEAALKNAADPYYCYPPPYSAYYGHQYPYQYQYPQPYPAYACGGPAMYGYPHPHYPPDQTFSEENPNACTIV